MKLQFLGSGNAFAPGGRGWSCFLAGGRYLFDCGPQALPALKRLHVELAAIEAIFVTHFHADHWLGLPFIYLEYDEITERARPLQVIGPPGIEETAEAMYERVYFKQRSRVRFARSYTAVQPRREGTAAGVRFLPLPMNHAREKLQAFGYRLQVDGKILAYTGDTAWCDEVVELGAGADALVVDATYPGDGDSGTHMGFNDIRRLRGILDPQTTLVLTHLERAPDEELPNTLVAEDFATYEI